MKRPLLTPRLGLVIKYNNKWNEQKLRKIKKDKKKCKFRGKNKFLDFRILQNLELDGEHY